MWYKWFYKVPLFLVLAGLVIFLLGYVVMLLWNALIPPLFNGPVLTFWQTVGILVLFKIFFHNHRFNSWHYDPWRRDYHHYWKHKFEAKLASMTPEEKEKFKEEWKRRCNPRYWNHRCTPDDDIKSEKD